MYRYLAFAWDFRNEAALSEVLRLSASLAAQGIEWVPAFSAPGIRVFTEPENSNFQRYMLPNNQGIILGKLFTSTHSSTGCLITPSDCYAKWTSEDLSLHRLLTEYWGGYVAFLRSEPQHDLLIVRDCSGRIPCYKRHWRGIEIVFSDIEALSSLALTKPSLNWKYLAAFVYCADLQIRQSGLNEVMELLAGDSLSLQRGETFHLSAWNPHLMCHSGMHEDYEELVTELRNLTALCIDSWAAANPRLLLSLSGGFDSAVVLACLAHSRSKPSITCFTRYASNPGEDERRYASLAVKRASVELVEAEWETGRSNLRTCLNAVPCMPKPSIPLVFGMLEVPFKNVLAEHFNASAIFTGQGGDHLFFKIADPVGAADFRHNHGIRLSLINAAIETARVSKRSFWSVLRTALRSPANDGGNLLRASCSSLLSRDRIPLDLPDYVMHPWITSSKSLPPGKRLQISLLAELTNRHRPIGRLELVPEIHPLISQPLMEFCLGVPTYLLLRSGRQRGMARQSFREELPEAIVNREDKGGITTGMVRLIRYNRVFLRELLFDGQLAREGLLDKDRLQTAIGQAQPMRAEQIAPLLAAISAELWCQSWT